MFPSGRAFGYIAYPPRPDGEKSHNEGYVFTGDGELIPAIAVEAPWLRNLQPSGEDVSLVLESDLARTRIEGELLMAAPHFSDPAAKETMPPLTQSIVRYRGDGEGAYGMMERSNLPERVSPYRWMAYPRGICGRAATPACPSFAEHPVTNAAGAILLFRNDPALPVSH